MARIPAHLRVYDKLHSAACSLKSHARFFFSRWHGILGRACSDFRKSWLYDHVRFVLVYGILLSIIFAVLLGQPFSAERVVALGLAYYFFRFELFYWLRGIKG